MSDELRKKITKLPLWAREHIHHLEIQLRPQVEETTALRRVISSLEAVKRKQKDQIEAMVAMFHCAAKGGNEIAQAVQRIVEDFLVSDEE